jgi:ribose transport system substrate-binding protein
MKKTIMIVLCVLLIGFLALPMFAAGVQEGEKELVIGQVFWGLHDSYQHAHQVQTAKYLEELGIRYIPMDGQMKPEVQTAAMEDLIARGVDGIICQAYDQASMEISIKAAQDAGIPVVSFVNIASAGMRYPTVEIAEEAGAVEMGRRIADVFLKNFRGKQMKVVTISDPAVEWAHNQRTLAFLRGLKEKVPTMNHVFNGGKSNREEAYKVVEDVLQRTPDINVVFGYDAENGLGGYAALEAAGRGRAKNKAPLTEIIASVDGSTPEILKVADPNSSYMATLALRPRENARSCVDMLLKIINGEMSMYATDQNVKVVSFVVDGSMSIDDIEKFLMDEWEVEIDIREELGL